MNNSKDSYLKPHMKVCHHCGREFSVYLYDMSCYAWKDGGHIYCSYQCMVDHELKRPIRESMKLPRY